MRRALLVARSLGVCTPPPEVAGTNFNDALDALNTGGSLVGHWPMGTDLNARIGGTAITASGTHETGLPQLALGGVPSRAFDGAAAHGNVALTNNVAFVTPSGTVGLLIQPDSVAAKANFVNLSDGAAGSFSLESNAGGQPRVFRRRTDGTSVSITGSGGQLVAHRPWVLACTWGAAGLKLYLMDATRAPGLVAESPETAWVPAVAAGQDIFIGRWHSSAVDHYDGVLGHLFWFNRQLSLAELETLAPLVRQVSYLPSFNAGNVAASATTPISMLNRGHPVDGFTLQRVAPNPDAGRTATVNGTSIDFTAGAATGADDFGVTLTTAEGIVSAAATVTVSVQAAASPQVFAHSYGPLAAGSTTDLNVLDADGHGAAAQNLTNGDLTIHSSPSAGTLSRINNTAPTKDQLRFVAPSPSALTSYVGTFSADGSNQANVAIQVNAAGATYTPFPFVTIQNPSYVHSGGPWAAIHGSAKVDVRARPPYNASSPRSVSKIDPMTGIELFRLSGDVGTPVLRNGSISTGLIWPRHMRQVNNTKTQQTFNCDGTLLMIGEGRRGSVPEPANACGSCIFDVNDSHGTGGPWRIIRASSTQNNLGDNVGLHWVWDRNDPMLAYAILSDGLYKWWPIGDDSDNRDPGDREKILNWPSGFNFLGAGQATYQLWTNYAGNIQLVQARRNSDNIWGAFRVDMYAPSIGSFIANPNSVNDHTDRGVNLGSCSGLYGWFTPGFARPADFDDHVYFRATDGAIRSRTEDDPDFPDPSHPTVVIIDGVDYMLHHRSGHWIWAMNNGGGTQLTNFSGSNPNHNGSQNFKDTYEIVGDWPGHTGTRYSFWSRSASGVQGVMGIRLRPGSFNQCRFLFAHRSEYSSGDNIREVHSQPNPTASMVVFNSSWKLPGVTTDGNVNPYVALIPDAWRSPNNDGS